MPTNFKLKLKLLPKEVRLKRSLKREKVVKNLLVREQKWLLPSKQNRMKKEETKKRKRGYKERKMKESKGKKRKRKRKKQNNKRLKLRRSRQTCHAFLRRVRRVSPRRNHC